MSYIIEFFDWLVNLITTVWDFFQGLLENFLMFFKYLASVSTLSKELILSMPSWLQVFGFITITVSILYLVLGRQTGGSSE